MSLILLKFNGVLELSKNNSWIKCAWTENKFYTKTIFFLLSTDPMFLATQALILFSLSLKSLLNSISYVYCLYNENILKLEVVLFTYKDKNHKEKDMATNRLWQNIKIMKHNNTMNLASLPIKNCSSKMTTTCHQYNPVHIGC